MNIHLLIVLLISASSAFVQDTISYDLLNRRMPLNLNEQITYLRNVTPYTGTSLKADAGGIVLEYNNFLEGRMHGTQTKFYPTGELKEKVQFKFGRANGHLTLYYKTGKKMSQLFFEEGVLKDTSKTWYPSGEIKSLSVEDRQNPANGYYCAYYKNGKREMEIVGGFQTIYYESGEKRAEVLLVMGRPKGEFKKYKKNGKIEIIEIWENGKIIDSYKKKKK